MVAVVVTEFSSMRCQPLRRAYVLLGKFKNELLYVSIFWDSLRSASNKSEHYCGKHSYYSGYYHGHSFDDCVRYLHPERDDVDKLVIGSFVL